MFGEVVSFNNLKPYSTFLFVHTTLNSNRILKDPIKTKQSNLISESIIRNIDDLNQIVNFVDKNLTSFDFKTYVSIALTERSKNSLIKLTGFA